VEDEIRREDEKQKTEFSVGKQNGPTQHKHYLSLLASLTTPFLSTPNFPYYLPL